MRDVALEVPLTLFLFGRLLESDDASATRIQVFRKALDRTTLTGSVTTFEDDDQLLARFLDPGLELQKFNLKLVLFLFISLTTQAILIGISTLLGVAFDFSGIVAVFLFDVQTFLLEHQLEKTDTVSGGFVLENRAHRFEIVHVGGFDFLFGFFRRHVNHFHFFNLALFFIVCHFDFFRER